MRDPRLEPVQRYSYYEHIREDSKESISLWETFYNFVQPYFYNTSHAEKIFFIKIERSFYKEVFFVLFPEWYGFSKL